MVADKLAIISQIRDDLKKNIDDQAIISGQKFFKTKIKIYGVKSTIVRKISNSSFEKIRNFNKLAIFK